MILPPGQPIPIVVKRPNLATAPMADWPTGDYAIFDRFAGPALSRRWSLFRSGTERWWRTGARGLSLTPRPVELGAKAGQPSFVGFRQAHLSVTATVTVAFAPRAGDRAGLAAVQDERRWLLLAVARSAGGGREVRLIRRNGPGDPIAGLAVATAALPARAARPVRLRATIDGPTCRFAYLAARAWKAVGTDQDCAMLSNRVARGFTGVMIGPAAIAAP